VSPVFCGARKSLPLKICHSGVKFGYGGDLGLPACSAWQRTVRSRRLRLRQLKQRILRPLRSRNPRSILLDTPPARARFPTQPKRLAARRSRRSAASKQSTRRAPGKFRQRSSARTTCKASLRDRGIALRRPPCDAIKQITDGSRRRFPIPERSSGSD